MKEYNHMPEASGNKVEEPAAGYGAYVPNGGQEGLFDRIMDELLQQSNDVKLMVIGRLVESMQGKSSQVAAAMATATPDDGMNVNMAEARQHVKLLSLHGEIEVPSDEKGIDALLDAKY